MDLERLGMSECRCFTMPKLFAYSIWSFLSFLTHPFFTARERIGRVNGKSAYG